jgi:hypothetical protein
MYTIMYTPLNTFYYCHCFIYYKKYELNIQKSDEIKKDDIKNYFYIIYAINYIPFL